MATTKVINVVIFGEAGLVEYYLHRLFPYKGHPKAQAKKITYKDLSFQKLKHICKHRLWRKPLLEVEVFFEYPEPTQQFLDELKNVLWHLKEVGYVDEQGVFIEHG